ncbi:universal stress protein [Parvibaculum sp.]|uniref:universal stress protein n=1 Tax=Parvibaculum sp. TaxID=2024848 RepID=UPI0027301BC8|nr:universal stress protein [Parvibaculum sp.]MDP1626802.1 universal stress protein [Parvibaculum sp.]MDP2148448.1 universal stress protein [Parvibaculum sp.]MDP3329735.1 universal stress protein [Parvibaculum sp.]
MSVRKILVPLAGRPEDDEVLATALSVARDFKAQLVGLFARPDPSEALPYLGDGVSGQVIEDLMQAAREGADQASARVRAALEKSAAAMGIPVAVKGADPQLPSARFLDVTGRRDEVVAAHSRLSDLIVFGEGTTGTAGGTALEAAMMSAGRPVLIAPKKAWSPVGGTVAIGWDDSAEAARAVTAAIPFLERAKSVTILCIGGKELDPTPGSTLADYLALHGVVADVHLVDAQTRAYGEVLLEQAEKSKTDLLVMGGYSHSRLREFIIGGATQHIRSHATIPVLMAH